MTNIQETVYIHIVYKRRSDTKQRKRIVIENYLSLQIKTTSSKIMKKENTNIPLVFVLSKKILIDLLVWDLQTKEVKLHVGPNSWGRDFVLY